MSRDAAIAWMGMAPSRSPSWAWIASAKRRGLHLGMRGNGDDPIEDFPLGDGTADTVAHVICPYCGEPNEIAVDPGSGASQDYIEDCQVCCQPWRVTVSYDGTGAVHVHLDAADDT